MNIKVWLQTRVNTGCERGITLVEAAVAVALLGGVILTMVLSMSGGALAVREDDREVIAQGLARTEMEYVKECAYDPDAVTYPAVTAPEGYSIDISVAAVPGAGEDIQKVTADIINNGETILTIQDYKVNR
jgi:type II secretory pathway pseudopilin PulG